MRSVQKNVVTSVAAITMTVCINDDDQWSAIISPDRSDDNMKKCFPRIMSVTIVTTGLYRTYFTGLVTGCKGDALQNNVQRQHAMRLDYKKFNWFAACICIASCVESFSV